MCGIAGFAGEGDQTDVKTMTAALAHRGPDGDGFFFDEDKHVFLGHRRLSIIDIAGGHQPMWNEDNQIGTIFNGEIYNHAELRQQLIDRGHVFRSSHSDTEVLVHGYEEWGEALPERLNGMFAFAIYDRQKRRLFLARDRFGEKPLYYLHRPGLFAFASELSSLTLHSRIDRSLDVESLQKLFAYGYIPAPYALHRGSRKLPGGHHLVFEIDDWAINVKPYWQFRIEPNELLDDKAEPALVDELEHLLGQAVRRRLMSDVPLGLFLSGGLDSSTVLAMTSRYLPASSIRTFTVGFREKSFDESHHARIVAKQFDTRHNEETLSMDRACDLIPDVLRRLDEPFGDGSILPTYLLSKFTRKSVTVALSGDGGDELFAGYDPFKALAPALIYARLVPKRLHNVNRRLADLLPISPRNMSFDFKIRRALAGLSYPPSIWNPVWMSPVEPKLMAELFQAPVRLEDVYGDAIALWESGSSKNFIDRTLEFFTNFYLPNDVLFKVDRASMMSSLETRAIFLDNDLVEFCRRLPHRFKLRDGERKYLLKKVMARHLAPAVLSRRKKGFGIPLLKWLAHLPGEQFQTIPGVNSSTAEHWSEERRKGSGDHRLALWTWCSLQQCLAAGRQPA